MANRSLNPRPSGLIGPLSGLNKRWPLVFSQDRHLPEVSWLEQQRKDMGITEGDELRTFLEVNGYEPFRQFDDIMRFCERQVALDVNTHARRGAWLDDRSWEPTSNRSSKECYRAYKSPLSAAQLHESQKRKTIGHVDLPDADRRLIYVSDIDILYLDALINTVLGDDAPVLKDTVWKHVALQTSLGVRIPTRGYPVFRMELCVPFYALRTYLPREETTNPTARVTRDLSFLIRDFPGTRKTAHLNLHEVHVAVAICGISEKRWTAYCFEDTAYDPDRALEEDDFCYDGANMDPIASTTHDGVFLDANWPLREPRVYFITILRYRICQICFEWTGLIRTVEGIIHGYTDGDLSFPKASGPSARENEEMVQAFEWTHKTLRLIHKLLETLKKTHALWTQFTSPNGDVAYFTDQDSFSVRSKDRVQHSLAEIDEMFGGLGMHQARLEDLEKRLKSLEQQYKTSAQVLELRLALDSNKIAKMNGSLLETTLLEQQCQTSAQKDQLRVALENSAVAKLNGS
ncbi:hypothetical protein CC80DRAFT_225667 [Byssothecium circinans]|uniref:Uncharacterized protein n=1 Tax=Byssothecium circinans TaxID=147558 RepID=A0A6A5TD68_9PLEO|nr:hypothetical protein CC80DRAFT_225667 [Byssothecium circinans]